MLLPFGGTRERGGHKGYGIAVIVDIMSGILSGNRAGYFANDRYSQFVMAFNIDAFMDVDQFKHDMDEWMETLANTPPAPGPRPRVLRRPVGGGRGRTTEGERHPLPPRGH